MKTKSNVRAGAAECTYADKKYSEGAIITHPDGSQQQCSSSGTWDPYFTK